MSDLVAFLNARLDEDELSDVYTNYDRESREVGAKRRIVALAVEWSALGDFNGQPQRAIEEVLRALAAIYSDHRDYDPAWGQ